MKQIKSVKYNIKPYYAMSKYLQYYKDVFEGKPYYRDGQEYTIKEKTIFDGGGIRLIYDELEYELEKRGAATVLDFGCGSSVHWHLPVPIPGQKVNIPATQYLGAKLRGFFRYDPAHPLYNEKPTGTFDIVMCTEVLEHIPMEEMGELLTEIASYMKDDGFAIFTMPKGLSSNTFQDGKNLHCTLMSTKEWNDLIEQYISNFVVIHHGKA
jgi:SAM-dependent methyltransferase